MTNLTLVANRQAALPPAQWAHDIRNLLATIGLHLESLARLLEDGPVVVEVLGIPNARVHADEMRRHLLEQGEGTVGAIKGLTSVAAVEPEDLWSLRERQGYAVRVTWSRDHGVAAVDALFERPTGRKVPQPWSYGLRALGRTEGSQTNNPLQSRQAQRLVRASRFPRSPATLSRLGYRWQMRIVIGPA